MNNILLNLSGKIDSQIIEALATVSRTTLRLNIPFFVIGAFARDIAMISAPQTYRLIMDILQTETELDGENRLASSMISAKFDYDKQLASILLMLQKLKKGFIDYDL